MHLVNFEGPFDLLLSLIAKHKLDITEVALSKVTDEFIAHVKTGGQGLGPRGQTTSFLLVASTLLDLKAARLLPQGDVEDEEDLALLEARDLLFARLMQYKAFKQVAGVMEKRLAAESLRHPRSVGLEERFAVAAARGADRDRAGAVRRAGGQGDGAQAGARGRRCSTSTPPGCRCASRAALVIERLRRGGTMTFRALCGDSPDTLTTVAGSCRCSSSSARERSPSTRSPPLGELTVRWTGAEDADIEITDEFDGAPPEADGDQQPTDRADEETT